MKYAAHYRSRVPFTASVRVRLTLWYLALMGFIILVFGGSLYGSSQIFLNTNAAESRVEAQLYQDSQQFAAAYKQALATHAALTSAHLSLSSQEMALLLGPDGAVLDPRGPLTDSLIQQLQARAGQNAGLFDLAVPQSHQYGWGWGQWNNSDTYRVLVTPVLNQNARVATLLVGLPRPAPTPLLAIWLFWGTMALLVAAIGGYWLAGKALRPVQMITRTANEMNATDLRRRLHLQRRDEFGELAATFDHMLARLEAAFKRQTQFTADASHELRTPLTVMGLEINRALTQLEQPEDYRQVLEHIQAENEQLITMVNRLLLLARADTGQMTLELQKVDLSDLALASVERLLPLARQSQIALATGDLPEALVRGDPRYLSQMLTNLIENAIKYSSGIGKRVQVELACEEGRWAVVRVQDDGPGIAEEHLPYLFERFYRVDKARSRREKALPQSSAPESEQSSGTGLGLAIVQWIVQAHGGEVRVQSAIGAGARFEVRLPLLKEAAERSVDDKSMTKSGSHLHAPVIFPGHTEIGPSDGDNEKEPSMSQISLQQQTSTFMLFRLVVVCEAIIFLVASALHTGAFGVPSLFAAMIVEGLCGIGCVISAYAIFTRQRWARKNALITQILILVGVLAGVFAITRDASIRTPLNLILHGIMLVLIMVGLSLLSLSSTRQGFGRNQAPRFGED
ncbi:MAG TPA: ATP-binding protein [Ktedonobacterales bacterium]|nr:ATP-binding protein [Ktedonobacterales bacterium]